MGILDATKLPLGYSTGYPPVLGECDHYRESRIMPDSYLWSWLSR
jgi:hypothetical protein